MVITCFHDSFGNRSFTNSNFVPTDISRGITLDLKHTEITAFQTEAQDMVCEATYTSSQIKCFNNDYSVSKCLSTLNPIILQTATRNLQRL